MAIKKTTTTLDNETYYFLYQVALIELEKENKTFNKLYDVIYFIFAEVKKLSDENLIDFNDEHLLKFIDNSNKLQIFLSLNDTSKNVIDTFTNEIKNRNKLINIKKNQIIKTIIILYYKSLLN